METIQSRDLRNLFLTKNKPTVWLITKDIPGSVLETNLPFADRPAIVWVETTTYCGHLGEVDAHLGISRTRMREHKAFIFRVINVDTEKVDQLPGVK